jgi:hypothetical protein
VTWWEDVSEGSELRGIGGSSASKTLELSCTIIQEKRVRNKLECWSCSARSEGWVTSLGAYKVVETRAVQMEVSNVSFNAEKNLTQVVALGSA